MTGLFADKAVNSSILVEGYFISGETKLLLTNLQGVVAVVVFTAIMTFVLIKIVNIFIPIRVTEESEDAGLDNAVHGEMLRVHER